ncbi:MAG TPA: type II toxin-antitoxin system HicB family antitoxin [Candidatus Binatia bacterium]|nr:type II toxin-antitoxin system HicB family antitoxin [Candidatus Binatia bacterium]
MHAVINRDGRTYVAECLEIAVVTQGRTLDETIANLEEAIDLHLEGEDPGLFGLSEHPRLVVTYEPPRARGGSRA